MISVGIDVSKEKSTLCMLKPYGEIIVEPYEIQHNSIDLDDLIKKICSFKEDVRVVMESTGAYHLPVLTYLKEHGIFVSIINPIIMKRYSTISLRKAKTDKIDCLRIANFGIDNWFKLVDYKPSDEIYSELKILGRQYSHYLSMKVNAKLNLTNILDRTMPGIKNILNYRNPNTAENDKLNEFVKRYWHYDNITKMSEKKFIEHFSEWAKKKGYRNNERTAIKIYALAHTSIPTLASTTPSCKVIVLEAIKVLTEINKTLDTILTRMKGLAKSLKEYKVVREMNGVGDVLAPRLIAEIGDVRRFYNKKALIAFAGIDSPPFQSGQFSATRRKVSKRGSGMLRKTGYEVMHCIKRKKPIEDPIYKFIIKKELEGKPKKVAKIAGLNKFLRIYYARVMEVYNS